MATDQIIVQSEVAAQFSQILKESLAKGANEQPLPKVVSHVSKARLQGLLSQAVERGASVIFGDSGKASLPGTAVIPTVLEGVNQSSDMYDEESFGPVAALTVVDSEDEAVNLANGSKYGLSASVFTKDLRKGLDIAKRLESG